MRFRHLAAACCLAPLVFASSAMAQDAAEKTYTLQPKYTAGEMLKYKFTMNMLMNMKAEKSSFPLPPNMTMKMSGTVVQKTKTVKPDGGAILTTEMRNGAMEVMGRQSEMPAGKPTTMEVDGKGSILKVESPEMAAAFGPGGGMGGFMNFNKLSSMGAILPDKPIKVGDKWERQISGIFGDQPLTVIGELLAVEKVGEIEALKIKQTMTAPLDMGLGAGGKPATDKSKADMTMKGNISVTMTIYLQSDNARMVKSLGKIKSDMEMKGAQLEPLGGSMSMDMDGEIGQELETVGKASDDVVPVAPKKIATKKVAPAAKTATKTKKSIKKKTGSGAKSN